jgi:hypothetical protein
VVSWPGVLNRLLYRLSLSAAGGATRLTPVRGTPQATAPHSGPIRYCRDKARSARRSADGLRLRHQLKAESVLSEVRTTVRAVVRDRLEFGAIYGTPLASQKDFNFNSLVVKMVLRY